MTLEDCIPFDLVIMDLVLHHLRTGPCEVHTRKFKCQLHPKKCWHEFQPNVVKDLFSFGDKILISELIEPGEPDLDKDCTGIGGYFTRDEFSKLLRSLNEEWEVEFFEPFKEKCLINKIQDVLTKITPGSNVGLLISKN